MNSVDIVYIKDAILLMERIQMDNKKLDDTLIKYLQKIKQNNEDIISTQNKLNLLLNALKNYPINNSDTTINQPLKKTEPMTVKDAIYFIRNSKIHLSEYGYRISNSFETRYNALKQAMCIYPLDSILQKLRALVIVWSQNTVDDIKFAEKYLNHLRTDFYTLQEEWLKSMSKSS